MLIDALHLTYMIKTWKHKGLQRFFETGSKAGIKPAHERRLKIILQRLSAAIQAEDMNTPGMQFHGLVGPLKGFYAVSVSGNWRVVFMFNGQHAEDVDYVDYH
jgi:proteic killer suppression protein